MLVPVSLHPDRKVLLNMFKKAHECTTVREQMRMNAAIVKFSADHYMAYINSLQQKVKDLELQVKGLQCGSTVLAEILSIKNSIAALHEETNNESK